MRTASTSFGFHGKDFIAGSFALLIGALVATSPTNANAQTNTPQTNAPMTVPTGQVPQPAEGGVNWEGVGYGAGTLAADVFYVPAKFLYALSGGLIGGGAYVLTGGNTQTANTIWRSSLGGDYVVTPDMIAGRQPVHFSGPTGTPPAGPETTVQPLSEAPGPNDSAPKDPITSSQGTETTAIK
jgi:hypothetical protein